jgi:uncharacterized protein YaaR (DUF327 family)
MNHLNIVTVVIEKHIKFLDLLIHTIKLNGGYTNLTIHVIINDDSEYFTNEHQVIIHRAPHFEKTTVKNGAGSFHHANALNNFIDNIEKVGYLLVIDPDMFVVYKGWISEIIEYMEKYNITLFGAPWHPQWYTKYRYFPCVHMLFINLKLASRIGSLNFNPQINQDINHGLFQFKRVVTFLRNKKVLYWLLSRSNINSSRDTGQLIYERFKCFSDSYNTLLPVVSLSHHFSKPLFLRRKIYRYIEQYIPSSLSFFPTKASYINIESIFLKDRIEKNLKLAEFFFWRGEVFSFHIRGESTPLRQNIEMEKVLEIYNSLTT